MKKTAVRIDQRLLFLRIFAGLSAEREAVDELLQSGRLF